MTNRLRGYTRQKRLGNTEIESPLSSGNKDAQEP